MAEARQKGGAGESTALTVQAAAGLPAELMDDMLADAGLGVSEDPNEVGIPFLYILQDMSPQVKKRDEAYIEGAEVGDFYNNVTKEVIPAREGFDWIEVGFEAAQVEWKPSRGGFVAKHPHLTPLRSDVKMVDNGQGKMEPKLPNGNILTETKYHYGLFRREGGNWEPAVIGMASTMIKCSRELEGMKKRLRLPNNAIAPSFAVFYHFGSTLVSKNSQEWFVWRITQVQEDGHPKWLPGELYRAARELAQQVASGAIRTATPGDEAATGSGAPSALEEETL